jgi:hypothetical protein
MQQAALPEFQGLDENSPLAILTRQVCNCCACPVPASFPATATAACLRHAEGDQED